MSQSGTCSKGSNSSQAVEFPRLFGSVALLSNLMAILLQASGVGPSAMSSG
jgi:hypothetical protein